MRTHYLLYGLLALVLAATAGWLLGTPSAERAPAGVAQSATGPASNGVRPPSGANPFLTTHEPSSVFTPDGDNLAPGFHVEMEALKRALDAAPDDTTALIRMARLLQDGHRTEEAAAYYRQYLDLRPQGRQAWLDLTQSYGALERWNDALATTEAMLRRFPDDPAALYNLGAIYANTGRFAEARATWERVTQQTRNAEMRTLAESALQRLTATHP